MNFEVKNLNCHYGVIQALRDVSFKIVEDGIYAVIGANGAGKSTLINVIAGLVPASSGEIIYGDTVITDLPVKDVIRRGISICPEGRKIFSTITVQENLMAGAYIIKDRQKIKENMDMVYEMFPRLFERKKQLAGTLSGGEQQMLAVGRALMSDPSFLLLDEPSMGLAPKLIDLVFDTIIQIHEDRKIPIMVVEQNSEKALSIADYAYVLEVGEITLQGTGKELLSSDEVQKKYLGA